MSEKDQRLEMGPAPSIPPTWGMSKTMDSAIESLCADHSGLVYLGGTVHGTPGVAIRADVPEAVTDRLNVESPPPEEGWSLERALESELFDEAATGHYDPAAFDTSEWSIVLVWGTSYDVLEEYSS